MGTKGDAMKGKAIIPLAIGLILGIFAISRGLSYVKSVKGNATRVQTVSVVTAQMEIPQGVRVTENMVTVKQVPKDLCPARTFSGGAEVLERVTCMIIPKDMPVLPTMLSPKGTTPGLNAVIPQGMRAVAVRVDEWTAVGGWLKPGVRVDVAVVLSVKRQSSRGKTQTISKTFLQNIEVAAVGATMGQNPQDTGPNVSRSVTLIVKPEDVAKIHLASSKGKINIAMRNALDAQTENLAAGNEDELLSPQSAQGKAKKQWLSATGGFFKSLFGSDESEQVVLADAELERCKVDLINGSRRERRVYLSGSSMEQVADVQGTTESIATGRVQPYAARTPRRVAWASHGGGDSDNDGPPTSSE